MEAEMKSLKLTANIIDLPNELWLEIFKYLPQIDHHAVGLVSKRFEELIDCIKLPEIPILEIDDYNIQEVKETIENSNNMKQLRFEHVEIEYVENIEDLEFILKSIGDKIEYLTIEETAAYHLLNCYVKNLKSLVLRYVDKDIEDSINNDSFDLCNFRLLEELSFEYGDSSTINKLLEQLKSPQMSTNLKHFTISCDPDTEDYLIDALLHHESTLESLDLRFDDYDKNLSKWNLPFSRMKNLKKLCIGDINVEEMEILFNVLPQETQLEHLELHACEYRDTSKLPASIVQKWSNSLKYLKLTGFCDLTDESLMELGKLTKLRVLKLLYCENITKMGFLSGIAKEENIFMDELHLNRILKLDDNGLSDIISRFPNLRYLTLKNLENAISDTTLASIFRYSTRLRSLFIVYCSNITDEGMIGFGENPYSINRLQKLEKLTLENCLHLTDRTFIESFKLPKLRELKLWRCPKITFIGIESLMKKCPLLEHLEIPIDIFTNDNALFVIGNALKHLRLLSINDYYSHSEEFREQVKKNFAVLQGSTFSPDCKLKFV